MTGEAATLIGAVRDAIARVDLQRLLHLGAPVDEYVSEALTLAGRLMDCDNRDDVESVAAAVFSEAFRPTSASPAKQQALVERLWQLVERHARHAG